MAPQHKERDGSPLAGRSTPARSPSGGEGSVQVSQSRDSSLLPPVQGTPPSSFLHQADDRTAVRSSRRVQWWLGVCARIPFVHSIFWLCFFLSVPYLGGLEDSRGGDARLDPLADVDGVGGAPGSLAMSRWGTLALQILTCWAIYGMAKFVATGVSSLYGVGRCIWGSQPRDWRVLTAEKRKPGAPHFDDVTHLVVIPNYKEPPETLARTLDTLVAQENCKQLVVLLAMEGRDPNAHQTALGLVQSYHLHFKAMYYTVHVLKPGEVGGKSSNENWAVRCGKRRLVDEQGLFSESIVVTTCDADTYFHPRHFSYLTYAYCTDDARNCKFWQACTCFYPNIDDVPALCAVRYALISVGFLGQLASPFTYSLPFSVYSLSLDLALRANFWDPTVIPEDWHMYLRCFYSAHGRVAVEPLFLPVGCECVVDRTALTTVQACYEQSKRWQWGAIDFGYILVHHILHMRSLPLLPTLQLLATAYEHHLVYNVMWVALVLAPYLFPYWGNWRFYLWATFLVMNWTMLAVLDGMYRTRLVKDRQHFHHPTSPFSLRMVLTLALFPFADFFLFVLPTFHAHARMALSTDFNYIVAPKTSQTLTLDATPAPGIHLTRTQGTPHEPDEQTPLFDSSKASIPDYTSGLPVVIVAGNPTSAQLQLQGLDISPRFNAPANATRRHTRGSQDQTSGSLSTSPPSVPLVEC